MLEKLPETPPVEPVLDEPKYPVLVCLAFIGLASAGLWWVLIDGFFRLLELYISKE